MEAHKQFYQLLHKDNRSNARAGNIFTAHGQIPTPIFMPVGTLGTVKTINQQQLSQIIHAKIILGNSYHLYLRPGLEVLMNSMGLHKFMGWDKPILTDSGGFQVFSLSKNRKITQEGVYFQSHIDGSKHLFSPEKVIDIQRTIGADIIMAFDECVAYPNDYQYVEKSMHLTHNWLDKCFTHFENTSSKYGYEQYLFPIVQGGIYKELRKLSCEYIMSKNAFGNAIGGLSVGEPIQQMYELTAYCCDLLPSEKPRYLMGVGTPNDVLTAIELGIDMMDCVMPTRNGRNGMLFTTQGIINIRNKKWQNDFNVIDPLLDNTISNYYSKAYLRHLFIANEMLSYQIASIQNLSFYIWLVTEARNQIILNNFTTWKNSILPTINQRL